MAHNPLAAHRRFPAVPAPHFVRPSAIDRPGRPRQLFLKKKPPTGKGFSDHHLVEERIDEKG